MAAHALLKAFRANKPAFGAWLTLPGVFFASQVAQASPHLSWILVDCEHGLVPLVPGAAESISSIQNTKNKPSCLVRIPSTGVSGSTSWQIKYALDAGAHGVLVPMVSTAEKAAEIVADSRLPPVGRRGFGSPFSANEQILVMIQIETKEAVENLDSIAKVDGLDVLFIGPYDLSISLGYPPPSPDPHPDVEEIIQRILRVSHEQNKKCAMYCINGEQAARRAAQGFDMINVATDVAAMAESIARNLNTAVGGNQK
ncbi:Pyruvate/Phosphoenolpyruvate kinase-like domain-containing protein [Cyathus striatus]|nr:Pyruvate/Phosphoenolpyruvate kinase-like domain-containing protein [Cyathus striatus]